MTAISSSAQLATRVTSVESRGGNSGRPERKRAEAAVCAFGDTHHFGSSLRPTIWYWHRNSLVPRYDD
jgi:hypothetical protein